MARPKPVKVRGLQPENGSWVVRMVVPVDVREHFQVTEFRQNLRTANDRVAAKEAPKVTAMWKGWIKRARAGEAPENVKKLVQDWKATQSRLPYQHIEPVTPENELVRLLYLALAGSSASGVGQVADHLGLPETDRVKLVVTKALMEVEQARILNGRATVAIEAANTASSDAVSFEQAAFGRTTHVGQVAEMSGWSIDSFYRKWSEERNTSEARLPHEGLYLRALKDFMGGDCDLATITRMKVFDFWRLVEKFPARRDRHAEQLPFTKAIKKNETLAGTAEWRAPLSASTRKNWLKFYNQMFGRAADLEIITSNPFKAIKVDVPEGHVTGEALSPDGVKRFFSNPFFQNERGAARWWLPIAALFTGCRIDELVSSYVQDFKQIDGVWCLDLTDRPVDNKSVRRVKNKNSRRIVPIHPTLLKMGFITWVCQQGAGTDRVFPRKMVTYSQFFSELMTKAGVTKKDGSSQSFHGLRHTFEREGRECEIDLEKRNLLTGHGGGGMGSLYGAGLSAPVLFTEISKTKFSTFPLT